MVEFMKTKERCLQCGEKLKEDTKSKSRFCSNNCKEKWDKLGVLTKERFY